MRLRNVPGSREAIAESEYAINGPELNKGKWKEIFGNDNPIRIEIGMGKGKFITTLAQQNRPIGLRICSKYGKIPMLRFRLLIYFLSYTERLQLANLQI